MRLRNLAAGSAIAMLAGLFAAADANAVTIVPTFDSSITTNAEAAQIEAAVNQVAGFYSAFSNNANVQIYYQLGALGGPGGQSLTSLYGTSYAGYTGTLAAEAAAHPENAVLNTAVANFGYGNKLPNIIFTSANAQALYTPGVDQGGITINGKNYDGVITLDTGVGAYDFDTGVVPGTQVSGLNVLYHETDEVLGVGGPGTWVGQTFGGGAYMGAEDLYRYDGVHSPSFTTSTLAHAYFSYDGGVTDVRDFNQNGLGDYADWARTSCASLYSAQSWADCYGDQTKPLTRTSDEVLALQAIGYNLAAVPEPGTWALLILGTAMIGFATRRRGQGAAAAA